MVGPITLCKQLKERILMASNSADVVMDAMARSTPKAMLNFEVALAQHCNLNCAYCDHFSPIAEPELADFDETARDFARLSELFDGRAKEIHLLGGEPLLHPDIIRFLKMARENFPKANINIVTNGIKLPAQPEEFWLACRDNSITICPTKYPISFDYDAMEERARQYQVKYQYFGGVSEKMSRMFIFTPLDPDSKCDGTRSFLRCLHANSKIYLEHGRLYTCPVAPTAHHLNRYFGTDFELLPEDSIDIYEASSAREILEFLARPIPFCRYCMTRKTKRGVPWRRSKKDIEEWIELPPPACQKPVNSKRKGRHRAAHNTVL